MSAAEQTITVGFDGSDESLRAVSWAVAEASRWHGRVHLVAVIDDPQRTDHVEEAVRHAAERFEQESRVIVTREIIDGHPVEQLLERSRRAGMLVLSARGRGGFAGALLGSVSTAVATHSSCPVVVVRGEEPSPSGPVVVGLDDSLTSQAALRFAAAAAARHNDEMLAVQAWHEEGLLAVPLSPADREQVQQRIEDTLADQVAAVIQEYPDVSIRRVALHGHPVAVLTDSARDARLLVVGHRGRGGFDGLFLGSVAAGVLHHAQCPVAVVRTPNET